MRKTKKLTLSAILVAMGAVLMALGGLVEVMDLSVCALASLIVAFAYIEIGSPYTWLIWLATSLITAIIFPSTLIWVEYFVAFGIWPIIKGYVERLPRWTWIPLKLVFVNAAIALMMLACRLILDIPFFEGNKLWLNAVTYALLNVTFLVYDLCITACVRFYLQKLQHRFSSFLR